MTSALGAFVRDQNGRGDDASSNNNNDWELCLECLLTLLHDDPVVTPASVGHASALHQQQQQPEERIVAEMSALLLQPHSTATSATTTTSSDLLWWLPRDWIDALQLLSSQILPHLTAWQLHAVVTHHSSLLCRLLGEHDDASPQQQQQQPHALFVPACLLLCAHAFHCPVVTSRRARWKSMLWETIRLVQRLVAAVPLKQQQQQRIVVIQQDQSNAVVVVHHVVSPHRLFAAVWQSHLVGALVHTYHALQVLSPYCPGGRPTDQRWDAAVCAAVVRTTARLATRGRVVPTVDSQCHHYHYSLERLVACLHGITAEPLEALLGLHPWRKHQQIKQASTAIRKPTAVQSSFFSWLTYYTTTTTTIRRRRDEASQQPVPEDDDDDDWWCLVETTWNDVTTGIALLVAGTWSQRPSGVWTGTYQWQLYFPHVSCLLLDEPPPDDTTDDDDMDPEEQSEQDDDDDNDDHGAAAAAVARCQCEVGYTLLQQLLEIIPRHSLDICATKSHPLHPAGTFQLLLNHMMYSPAVVDRPNDSTKQQQQQQQQLRAHRCVRDLLSKYQPYAQFRLVKDLIQSCPPHLTPTLVPKLLDLWRPLMVRQSGNDDCHDHNTNAATTAQRAAAALQQVWWFLDEQFMQPMDRRHVEILVQSSSQQSNSPTTCGGQKSDTIVAVKNVEGLLSSVEIYGAVLGLYQLWMKLHHEPVVVAHGILSQRLDRMHRAIAYTMQHDWSDHAAPRGELFRLHLLQDGLGQTLELLHQMG